MVDEHQQDVAIFQRLVEVDLDSTGAGEFAGEFGGIGFDDMDAPSIFAGQRGRNQTRRAFAEVVDVGFEGEAEAGDFRVRVGFDQLFRLADNMANFAIVDAARGADQRRVGGGAGNDEPRINRNTVACLLYTSDAADE